MPIIALDVGGSSVKHGVVDVSAPDEVFVHTTAIDSGGTAEHIIGVLAGIVRSHQQGDASADGLWMWRLMWRSGFLARSTMKRVYAAHWPDQIRSDLRCEHCRRAAPVPRSAAAACSLS